uniref:Uncharacterized protein n=1 Tax=Fusarium oxysporum (strain Fo5176) TaxID=660025 RepID=A0A0D2Y9U4_FUSOF
MAHAFSLQSIKEMEHFVDSHILKLRNNLDHFCDSNQDFDLKDMIALYVFDVLDALPWIKKVLPFIPIPWLQRLFNARAQLRNLTAACVRQRIEAGSSGRKDLLSCLLVAVDPETGSKLTELDINTEAFAMIKTTVFALNHVVHHNPSAWGKDHDQFIPDRFLGPNSKDLQGYLSPFSTGHRQQPPRIHNEIYPFLRPTKFRISLKGQVVLITGALGTMAGAAAESFATAGASLFLSDTQPSPPDSTKDGLLHLGADAVHYSRCDVDNPKDCEELG